MTVTFVPAPSKVHGVGGDLSLYHVSVVSVVCVVDVLCFSTRKLRAINADAIQDGIRSALTGGGKRTVSE